MNIFYSYYSLLFPSISFKIELTNTSENKANVCKFLPQKGKCVNTQASSSRLPPFLPQPHTQQPESPESSHYPEHIFLQNDIKYLTTPKPPPKKKKKTLHFLYHTLTQNLLLPCPKTEKPYYPQKNVDHLHMPHCHTQFSPLLALPPALLQIAQKPVPLPAKPGLHPGNSQKGLGL